jgi:hypothetical protein
MGAATGSYFALSLFPKGCRALLESRTPACNFSSFRRRPDRLAEHTVELPMLRGYR